MEAPTPEQYYKFAHHCANEDRNALADIFLIQSAILGHEEGIIECEQRGLNLKLERYQKKIVKELRKEALDHSGGLRASKPIETPAPKEVNERDERVARHSREMHSAAQKWKNTYKRRTSLSVDEYLPAKYFSHYVNMNGVFPEIVDKYDLCPDDLRNIGKSSIEGIEGILMGKKAVAKKRNFKTGLIIAGVSIILFGFIGLVIYRTNNPIPPTPEQRERQLYQEWQTLKKDAEHWAGVAVEYADKNSWDSAYMFNDKAIMYEKRRDAARERYYNFKNSQSE